MGRSAHDETISLYRGMIRRGLPFGLAPYLVLLLPPYQPVQWDLVGYATLALIGLVGAIVVAQRTGRMHNVVMGLLLNIFGNTALFFAIWVSGEREGNPAPVLIMVILFSAVFRGGVVKIMSLIFGVAALFAGSVLAGVPVTTALTTTAIFTAVGAGVQVCIGFVVRYIQKMADDLRTERLIAAEAANCPDAASGFPRMLPPARKMLGVTALAIVASDPDGDRIVAHARPDESPPAPGDLDVANGAEIGADTSGATLRLCLGAGEHADEETVRAIQALFQVVVTRDGHLNELRDQSLRDGLTGLANRRHLDATLSDFDPDDTFAVIIIDLDHFKELNDTAGHLEGDEVLTRAGAAIAGACRGTDVAARYGGEEFCIVMPETTLTHALVVDRRLRQRWNEAEIAVSYSAGVAASLPGEDPHHTLKRADEALYEAKRQGRARTIRAAAAVAASPPAVPRRTTDR